MGQTKTKRRDRRYTEARARAQRVLYAGPNKAVAEVLGISKSRACHLRTDEVCTALRDTMTFMLGAVAHPDVDALAVLEAFEAAYEAGALMDAEVERLTADGLRLIDLEAERDGLEDRDAVVGGLTHADSLGQCWPIQRRLEWVIRELAARGVDLHAVYRARAGGS